MDEDPVGRRSAEAGVHPSELTTHSFVAGSSYASMVPGLSVFAGQRIGSYTLIRQIGVGGMGVVYEAEQAHPRRRVALKVIRADRLSDERLRHFATESLALGRLQHSGIASIYEAGTGTTNDGTQPFFVMELVKDGRPIDRYASEERLTIRQRLELLGMVARAVHYAHEQGVIHLDLKPGNILVGRDGQPKILDFGLAQVISADLPAKTQEEEVRQIIGTLPYMSPEQAEGQPHLLDLRSDVYALGVIAYELLAKRRPHDLSGTSHEDAIRIIQQDKPAKIETLPTALCPSIEAVVSKALEKAKARRYPSARGFADDLNRLSTGLPTSASRPTRLSTVRLWMTREERIRQAALALVFAFAAVSLFHLAYLLFVGLSLAFGFLSAQDAPQIRFPEFIAQLALWTAATAFFAWVNWRAMQRQALFLWISLVGSSSALVFTIAVLTNVLHYDVGGALVDPVMREALYMLFTVLALLASLLSGLALIAFHVQQQWDSVPREGVGPTSALRGRT